MKKLFRYNKNNGFTVIELLMAIIILGVVMAAVTTMIVQSFNVFDRSTRRMSAGQLAELALSEVGGYLRTVTETIELNENGPWKFKGYHPNFEEEVEFNLTLNDRRLSLAIENENDYDRIIVNNVNDFNITKNETDEKFIILIEVKDEEDNTARKRLNVTSRNLQSMQE